MGKKGGSKPHQGGTSNNKKKSKKSKGPKGNKAVKESVQHALQDDSTPGGAYNIVTVDVKAPIHGSPLSNFLLIFGFVNLCLYLTFLVWNLYTATKQGATHLWSARFFAIGQIFDNASAFTESLWRMLVACIRNPTPRPTLRLVGDKVPSIDVFVVSCGEDPEVVMDTVKAACLIDYPATSFRVILADDSGNPELRKQVETLSKEHSNLHYHARLKDPDVHHGYKAGNINTTMRDFVVDLVGGQSEFFAVFDADMMPEPDVLRALVPHALKDERVGMVTVAQHFYNIPDNDPLYQSNITGTGCDDGIRDSVGAAWCPGCGFVMRTSAWKDIGGFPEFTITEDLITSWYLHGDNWEIVLVHEVMQWGMQPDCMMGHLKQRRRWWTGHILDSFRFGLTFTEPRLKGATVVQRIAMFHHSMRPNMGTLFKVANLIMVAAALACRGPVIAMPNPYSLTMMVSFVMVSRLLARFGEIRSSVPMFNAYRRQATNTWLGVHFARDVFVTVLPRFLGGSRLGFQVTGVDEPNRVTVKERSANRHSLYDRLRHIHRQEGILWYPVFVAGMSALIIFALWKQISKAMVAGELVADRDFWVQLISSVGFPGLGMIETLPLYLTPIVYLMFPPLMPDRRDTMVLDEKSGAWRPDPKYKSIKWTSANLWLCLPHWVGTIWVIVAFIIAARAT